MLIRLLPFLLPLALVPTMGFGQTIHNVGVGGFATIDAAIQIAVPGDIIRVGPGLHMSFTLQKGVTLRGTSNTQILTFGTFQPVINIAPGQQAHVTDLQFNTMSVSGNVTFDRCTFTGGSARFTAQNATLHMQRCAVYPSASQLLPSPPPATFHQCEVFASHCNFDGVDGQLGSSAAISLTNTRLYGSHFTIHAGSGTTAHAALIADAASTVVLSDSTLVTPSAVCPLTASQGYLTRCTLTPSCTPLPIQPGLGAMRPTDPFLGQQLTVNYHATPGDLVFVWAAFELSPLSVPVATLPLQLSATSAFPLTVLVVGQAGIAQAGWPIPFNPALSHRSVWLQGVLAASFPVPVSVATGGLIL